MSGPLLIVDDEPSNLATLREILSPEYALVFARSGSEALAAVAKHQPSLILLDVMMPQMDGYVVCRQLKADPQTESIPVIFVTALAEVVDEATGFAVGAVDYIVKPVSSPIVKARVRTHLELKKTRERLERYNKHLEIEVAQRTADLATALEAAEAASRSKSTFISTMSHELRTPMNGVIGMIQLAAGELPQDSPVQEYLEIALQSGLAMVDLQSAILEYSNIADGPVTLHREPVDIVAAVTETVAHFAPIAEKKGLRLTHSAALGTPSEIRTDEAQLRRVLAILVDNGIKFTRAGEVAIDLAPSESRGGVHFLVRDSGIGIDPTKQSAIFDPFSQVDGSGTRAYGGAGLGLAIAHRLIELMGGQLRVDSTPDVGSTFHFTLVEPASEDLTS